MPARGTRELLEKRRESDEQRVGERFGKVMRVELVGCEQEGEQNLEKEAGLKSWGTGREKGWRTHSEARTLRVITGDWENRCWWRGNKDRETEEEGENDLEQIAGCYSMSRGGWLL